MKVVLTRDSIRNLVGRTVFCGGDHRHYHTILEAEENPKDTVRLTLDEGSYNGAPCSKAVDHYSIGKEIEVE